MKPQSFAYAAPGSVPEVLASLAEHGDEAKVLAGGQSLVPMMALRLARPAVLVDVNGVAGLDRLAVGADGLRVGATVRHRRFDRPVEPGPLGRLLAEVAHLVGHPPIRNRGTMVGSLAHADPRAEWPLVAVALGATLVVRGPGERTVAVDDFLDGPFQPALEPTELVTELRWPALPAGTGPGFAEVARTAGAFLEAAACALLRVADGTVAEARLAVAGPAPRPLRLPGLERALVGRAADAGVFAEVAAGAPAALAELAGERAAYPARLLPAVCERALGRAAREAGSWS